MARWHFWLSLLGFASFIAGAAAFRGIAFKIPQPGQAIVNLVGLCLIAGAILFSSAQVWFAFGLVRAVLRMRPA